MMRKIPVIGNVDATSDPDLWLASNLRTRILTYNIISFKYYYNKSLIFQDIIVRLL